MLLYMWLLLLLISRSLGKVTNRQFNQLPAALFSSSCCTDEEQKCPGTEQTSHLSHTIEAELSLLPLWQTNQ